MINIEDKSWYDWAREQTDPSEAPQKLEALADLLVLDVSYGNIGGLVCSSMLAELGAQVIRIEPPEGDLARRCPEQERLRLEAFSELLRGGDR